MDRVAELAYVAVGAALTGLHRLPGCGGRDMERGGVTAEQVAKAVEDLLLDYQYDREVDRLIRGLQQLVDRVLE